MVAPRDVRVLPKKRRVGGRTSHLARGDRVPIHLLTYLDTTHPRPVGCRSCGCEGLRGGCPAAECAARAPARVFAAEGAALKEELFIPRNGLPASRDPAHLFFFGDALRGAELELD